METQVQIHGEEATRTSPAPQRSAIQDIQPGQSFMAQVLQVLGTTIKYRRGKEIFGEGEPSE